MKTKTLFSIAALFALALLILAGCSAKSPDGSGQSNVDYYTCAMHPSVHSQDPKGKCPICSMDLIAVLKKGAKGATNAAAMETDAAAPMADKEDADGHMGEFTVPVARQQMIGVTYATIEKRPLKTFVRAVGTVTYDKQRHWDFVSRVDGYIQKLEVSSRGDLVDKSQPLMTIYSPDLLTTEREFLSLLDMRDAAQKSQSESALKNSGELIDSARRRLAQWNITTNQISDLEQSRKASDTLTLYSPFRGVVQDLLVDQGRRVSMGDHLVDIADLSVVWVWAQFYQDELPLLKTGKEVIINSDSYPGETIAGKISLIDPFINDSSRTVRVRIEVQNPDYKLRPEMYVNVVLENDQGDTLAVPVSAVIPTGQRNVVFLGKGEGKLEPRFVELGSKFGDYYAVRKGLDEGDKVVSSANFLIDAESKIQGALKSW